MALDRVMHFGMPLRSEKETALERLSDKARAKYLNRCDSEACRWWSIAQRCQIQLLRIRGLAFGQDVVS